MTSHPSKKRNKLFLLAPCLLLCLPGTLPQVEGQATTQAQSAAVLPNPIPPDATAWKNTQPSLPHFTLGGQFTIKGGSWTLETPHIALHAHCGVSLNEADSAMLQWTVEPGLHHILVDATGTPGDGVKLSVYCDGRSLFRGQLKSKGQQGFAESASSEATHSDLWVVDRSGTAGYQRLFDGQTLEGWMRRGGQATYEVKDKVIVGTTLPGQPNTFLCTDRTFKDFALELEFKVDSELNSGIQIRSALKPDSQREVVFGYQIEIDPSPRSWSAGLYDESGQGWLMNLEQNQAARNAFHLGWNRFRIVAKGQRIWTSINGVPAIDFPRAERPSGFVGLQVHGVGDRKGPLQVRWRNIWLRELE